MQEVKNWSRTQSLLVTCIFVIVDATFFLSNSMKVIDGGYVPLLLAAAVFSVMLIWHRGSTAVLERLRYPPISMAEFLAKLKSQKIPRVPGTAVFLTRASDGPPPVLVWHVRQNRSLHKHVIMLNVHTLPQPRVQQTDRMAVAKEGNNLWRVTARYGFMERPHIPQLMHKAHAMGCNMTPNDLTYYVGHESVVHRDDRTAIPRWEEMLFAFMVRNSSHITDYFRLPTDSVVEIGRQIAI